MEGEVAIAMGYPQAVEILQQDVANALVALDVRVGSTLPETGQDTSKSGSIRRLLSVTVSVVAQQKFLHTPW